MNKTLKGKKGTITDIVFIGIFLLGFIMVVFVGEEFIGQVNENVENMPSINDSGNNRYIRETNTNWVDLMDGLFLTLFVGFILTAVVGAFLINTHPLFAVISFILLIVLILVVSITQTVYENVANTTEFSDTAEDYTAMFFVMNNFKTFLIVVAVLIGVVLYAKTRIT